MGTKQPLLRRNPVKQEIGLSLVVGIVVVATATEASEDTCSGRGRTKICTYEIYPRSGLKTTAVTVWLRWSHQLQHFQWDQ